MSYQEQEGIRLRRQSSKQAIALAMEGRWEEAVAANQGLLELFPDDVEAYNRLGRAYMELGDYSGAKKAYQKAIELDPYNSIASKNFNRLSHLDEATDTSVGDYQKVEPNQFIEEVGRAGVVDLYNLAPPGVLAKMVAGSRVELKVSGSNLLAENSRGEYLGQVDPRYGQRLVKLIEGGNRYSAAIISSTEDAVKVIIREVFKSPEQMGRLSFPPPKSTEGLRPYVADRIGDRIIRREIEYEQELPGEPSYTIIGGEETEVLSGDVTDGDDDVESEE
ncbi:MAG: tetratricopeptide repeat protein [Dehalococcoidales bacterium]|nr:tetratricopeptide repeat protein [Dehalococcoidales bacterium]